MTIVLFRGQRHIYQDDADAAYAIREYESGHENETDREVIRACQITARRAAENGQVAEVAVTHQP